jgi:hypothetical protein
MEIMKGTLIAMSVLFCLGTYCQTLTDYNAEKNRISKRGMITLGSWGLASAASGGIGWAASDNKEMQAFHQMNMVWGVVNLGLAIPSYIGAAKDDPSAMDARKSYTAQIKKEKLFLVNTAFDFVYVTSGVVMRERAKWDAANADRLRGWGNSFIIQGAFLCVFDFTMTMIHNKHRKNKFESMINISATPYGMGLRWEI